MDESCSMGKGEIHAMFWWGNLTKSHLCHLEDLYWGGSVILKKISSKSLMFADILSIKSNEFQHSLLVYVVDFVTTDDQNIRKNTME